MDPLSVVASTIAIIQLIAKTPKSISTFVRAVRESRSDLNEVDRELLSIKSILELIRDDLDPASDGKKGKNILPDALQEHILGILQCSSTAIKQIEESLD